MVPLQQDVQSRTQIVNRCTPLKLSGLTNILFKLILLQGPFFNKFILTLQLLKTGETGQTINIFVWDWHVTNPISSGQR